MERKFQFHVERSFDQMAVNIYLVEYTNGKRAYYQVGKDGALIGTMLKERDANFVDEVKPLLRLPFDPVHPEKELLQAIADGLKEYGIVPEVDNAQRITAQALADERGKTIDYFKELNTSLIKSLVKPQ